MQKSARDSKITTFVQSKSENKKRGLFMNVKGSFGTQKGVTASL